VLSSPLIEPALGASLPGAEEVGEIFAEAFLRAVAS
jgi:hypothetical protein